MSSIPICNGLGIWMGFFGINGFNSRRMVVYDDGRVLSSTYLNLNDEFLEGRGTEGW